MKINLNELQLVDYADYYNNKATPIAFDCLEINKAFEEDIVEYRSFQRDKKKLIAEWNEKSNGSYEHYIKLVQIYHITRIATIMKTDLWIEPIIVYKDHKRILDGQHRVWAAKCLKKFEIEAFVLNTNDELGTDLRELLWDKISALNGNVESALQSLNITYEK
jgi:hypothetical protein